MLATDGSRPAFLSKFVYLSIAGDMRKKKETCEFKVGRRTRVCGEDLTIDPPIGYATRTACLAEEVPSTPKTCRCEVYCRL